MFSVLIADDEKWVRRGLKTTIDWAKFDVGNILEARDGEEALQIVQSTPVDLIITDIKMPYRDGLEFIGELRQTHPDVKVIIISGYGEFALAQQALKLGAVDYLLKPIEESALEKVVAGCIAAIAAERDKNGHSLRIATEYLELARNRYLNQLITGSPIEPEAAAAKFDELEIKLDPERIVVIVFEPDGRGNPEMHPEGAAQAELLRQAREFCAKLGSGAVFEGPQGRMVALLTLHEEYSRNVNRLGADLEMELKAAAAALPGEITAGAGPEGPVNGIADSYQKCLEVLEYRFFQGARRVYHTAEFANRYAANIAELVPVNYDALLNNIMSGEPETVQELLSQIFRRIDGNLERLKPAEVRSFLSNLLAKINEDIAGHGGGVTESEEAVNPGTLPALYTYILDEAADLARSFRCNETTKKRFVGEAVKHLNRHYPEKIAMNRIAKLYYLNPSYFSKIFAAEVGETFHEYLSRIRIEHAKELLQDPSLKIYEVAEKVGYPDYRSFCKKFKELQGVTPLQFRNKVID